MLATCAYKTILDAFKLTKKPVFSILLLSLFTCFTQAQSAEKLYLKAEKDLENNKFASALKSIDEAINKEPYKYDYYITKGLAQQGLLNLDGAYQSYTIAITLDPKNKLGYNARGILLQSVQMFDESISDFSNVIKYAESDSIRCSGYLNRGASKENKRDFKGAYDDFFAAYKLNARDIGVLNNLGTVCFDLGMEEEGFEYLHQIIELDSTFVGSYVNLGFAYQLKGYYEKSILYFDKAEKFDAKNALVYSNRSYSKLKLGDLKGAMKDIEKSIVLYPGNSYAYRNRALIYIEMGDYAKACADLYTAKTQGFLEMYGEEVNRLIKRSCNN